MESNDDADAEAANILPQIILIIVLTMVNAFFASAELAVLSVNKNKIQRLAKEGNKKALALQKVSQNEVKFLSTIQVGITLAGFFSSATAAVSLSEVFGSLLERINVPYGKQVAMVIVTLVLSFFTLVFGELFPKKKALRNPERIALNRAKVLLIIKTVFNPFVKLLSWTCDLLVKVTGLNKNGSEEKVTNDDIIDIATTGVTEGTINKENLRMVSGALKLTELTATDIMTPRVDVFMINIEDDLTENLNLIIENQYSRVPVFEEKIDNIIGVLIVKDIVEIAYKKGFSAVNLKELLRKPLYVNELIKADELLSKMQETKSQITFLIDEFGGFTGIVSMEDLLEEIVGSIQDEYDTESNITRLEEGVYVVKGSTPIQEINQELELNFDYLNKAFDTIAGFMIYMLDYIPSPKDIQNPKNIIKYKNTTLRIEEMTRNRIMKVRIIFDASNNISNDKSKEVVS